MYYDKMEYQFQKIVHMTKKPVSTRRKAPGPYEINVLFVTTYKYSDGPIRLVGIR